MHVNCESIKKDDHCNKLTGLLHVLHPSVPVLTDSWLCDLCVLPTFDNYNAYHIPKPTQKGDGVTFLINKIFDSHGLCLNYVPKTFEYSFRCIPTGASNVVCWCVQTSWY